ncbi:MAG: M50 family metallopeptidase [Gemmataceae bacterium]
MFSDRSTPFDLSFRFLGFPCTISGLFWLGSVLLGNSEFQAFGLRGLLAWVVAMLISILIHELGHAIMARSFGCRVHDVRLTLMGGFCAYDREPMWRWQRIAISLAGPFAGFLFWGILKGSNYAFGLEEYLLDKSIYLALFYYDLLFINLVWGLFNLLPVLPMDGGRVCYELCGQAGARHPYVTARWIGVGVAGGLAVISLLVIQGACPQAIMDLIPSWLSPNTFLVIWMAMFAVQNYMEIQAVRAPRGYGYGNENFYEPDDDSDSEAWKRR